jgi:hypothetical protein
MKHRIAAQRVPLAMLLVFAMAMAMSSVTVVADVRAACAHDDTSARCGGPTDVTFSYTEDFEGEGVAGPKKQRIERDVARLPVDSYGVTLVSKLRMQDREAGLAGRIADVAALGNHAYLTAFRDPACTRGGVHVVDIANPERPKELVGSFIPTSTGSYAGEGIKVFSMANEHFTGDVLVFQNESCGTAKRNESSGGISLWDVTRPRNPRLLAAHQGDFTVFGQERPFPNQVHSFDVWTDRNTGRTYAALVDNEEWTDVDIMDITDPRNPVLINDTLDLFDATFQAEPAGLSSVFSHDMDVKEIAGPDGLRYVMALNYWDGGYVLLDVTDPTVEGGLILANSEYAELDEERLKRGEEITPEGNAHQSELSRDNDYLLGTDEDFDPYRTTATIADGPYEGESVTLVNGAGTPPLEGTSLSGATTYVGEACGSLPPATTEVALVERGTCFFQDKLDAVTAAGYELAIVFNNERDDCLSLLTMLADGDLPFLFANRLDGLRLLGQEFAEADACSTATGVDEGGAGSAIEITSVFAGWGYVRLFAADVGDGTPWSGSLDQIDTYAIPESQDPAFATGYGDLSVHEVAMDERRNDIAYLSYYAGGFRIVQFGDDGITEIGAFVDAQGSNFWGVEIHTIKGKDYVLASDRDYGLYIFETVDP